MLPGRRPSAVTCRKLQGWPIDVPVLGQGLVGGSAPGTAARRELVSVLRQGAELGVTLWDTAPGYEDGAGERLFGEALKAIRDRIFLCTKFEPEHSTRDGVQQSLEASLRRLGTDYVDLYQQHWPNPAVPIQETMEGLAALRRQGKVRHVGLGNCPPADVLEALQEPAGKWLVSVQAEYNLRNRLIESELLPACAQRKICVLGYSPFQQGGFAPTSAESQLLGELAKKYGVTVRQVVLSWLLRHDGVIMLTRTTSRQHQLENVAASLLSLDPQDIERVNERFREEIVRVPVHRIRVVDRDVDARHVIYTSLEEAIRNAGNVHPSASELAEEIRKGRFLKPVELSRRTGADGAVEYDLVHGRMRYWAWVIARPTEPIPAIIAK